MGLSYTPCFVAYFTHLIVDLKHCFKSIIVSYQYPVTHISHLSHLFYGNKLEMPQRLVCKPGISTIIYSCAVQCDSHMLLFTLTVIKIKQNKKSGFSVALGIFQVLTCHR